MRQQERARLSLPRHSTYRPAPAARRPCVADITSIHVWAPEIKAPSVEGLFNFHPCAPVSRETLVGIVDGFKLAAGDIVVELATRIDTVTMGAEVKSRGAHFLNTGFDVWPDVELDLNLLDGLRAHAAFKAGAGRTCVFSFGCNPGIASHFVRHGLRAVTGCTDMKAAAAAFGLRSIIFAERDTQWPVRGSKEEAFIADTQTTVLYNTWSPGNYIVETVESTILYAGCPEAATKVSAAGPAITSWTPIGPILGFAAPHDECFTVQPWFDKLVPALFIYEAPATARNYVKGGAW